MVDVIESESISFKKIHMNNFAEKAENNLKLDEAMSAHTSWQVGGKAKRYFVPENINELSAFLKKTKSDEALFWLGLGSNVLIRDGGFDGTVISTAHISKNIKIDNDNTVTVDSGVPCPKFARYCAKQGLEGAEFFAGIPGTIGGALAMNAGAFGGETWTIVKEVKTINRKGKTFLRTPKDFNISYRTVTQKNEEWFLSASFQLLKGDKEVSLNKIKSYLAKRKQTQPTGIPSCGSVFRNPEDDYAARLIEACGLKGKTIGGAKISEKHANFIVNTGNATAADIESLINLAWMTVKEKFNIELIREVHIIGQHTNSEN